MVTGVLATGALIGDFADGVGIETPFLVSAGRDILFPLFFPFVSTKKTTAPTIITATTAIIIIIGIPDADAFEAALAAAGLVAFAANAFKYMLENVINKLVKEKKDIKLFEFKFFLNTSSFSILILIICYSLTGWNSKLV